MSRTARHITYVVWMLVLGISYVYPTSAAILNPADDSFHSRSLSVTRTHGIPFVDSSITSKGDAVAASHDVSESHIRDFMQQITQFTFPIWMELLLVHPEQSERSGDDALQLFGQISSIRANGTNQLPLDSQWLACCGDGTVLATLDNSFRTLVNTSKQQSRRSASLVSIAQTGTALPLSFEVSRRVRAQSVPEPASISLMAMASLVLLRRRRRRSRCGA